MEKQYQIRKDAETVLNLANKGSLDLTTAEKSYLTQAIKTYDWSLKSGDLSPAGCRKFLRMAVKKVTIHTDPVLQ